MNKHKRHPNHNKLTSPDNGSSTRSFGFDENDIDESSIMGTQARSSVRGAMSDYADSTIGAGLVTPRSTRQIVGVDNHVENSTAVLDGDDEDDTKTRSMSVLRIFRWWSGVVSRVSRSASSLLNQHSPNINDILEGTGDNPIEQPPRRGVQESIPENPHRSSMSIDDDANEKEQEVFALREEVALLKKRIQELEDERVDNQHSLPEMQNQNQPKPGLQNASTADISDIPSITPIQMLRPDQISRYSRQLLLGDDLVLVDRSNSSQVRYLWLVPEGLALQCCCT